MGLKEEKYWGILEWGILDKAKPYNQVQGIVCFA